MNNKGSAVVEAVVGAPLFLMLFLCLYMMCMAKQAEACVYEAAVETAEYTAESAYISEAAALAVPFVKFSSYVDDEDLVERYISGGKSGVNFLGTYTDDGYLYMRVSYTVVVNTPLMPKLERFRTYVIKQRIYDGAGKKEGEEAGEAEESYVYITDNKEVYHESRSCTHLSLSIHGASLSEAKDAGYKPCEFCGAKASEYVYITDEGDKYHCGMNCSGLKRTVYRIKKSEAGGIPPCSRCSGG
ncbi:MAG: pilus assembly protein [Lachnospiraceae bacterium]|nr:pilus assembly protein [Lachnospiraceae bacterium]